MIMTYDVKYKELKEAFGKMKDKNNMDKDIDLKTMEWKNINENKPIDGARVLVCDTEEVWILTLMKLKEK